MNMAAVRGGQRRVWRERFVLPTPGSMSLGAERMELQSLLELERARVTEAEADLKAANGRAHLRAEYKVAWHNARFARERVVTLQTRLTVVECALARAAQG